MHIDALYVAKTINLRRRFDEHADLWREHNKILIAALLNRPWECWFAEIDLKDIDEAERRLISETRPPANHIHYKNWKKHE